MELKISKILSQLMHDQHLTLRELSKRTGVAPSTLSEWQGNRKPKDPLQIKAVSNALGVSMNYLLFGEEDAQEPIQRVLREDFFSGMFEITLKRVKISDKS